MAAIFRAVAIFSFAGRFSAFEVHSKGDLVHAKGDFVAANFPRFFLWQ